mmetsp:Transcript_138889/g.241650  ORF Transcript_138889/g.241650 Transcript_138889/m.241650 type:complete len:335 (-) Transcript_138889:139-1143(-)
MSSLLLALNASSNFWASFLATTLPSPNQALYSTEQDAVIAAIFAAALAATALAATSVAGGTGMAGGAMAGGAATFMSPGGGLSGIAARAASPSKRPPHSASSALPAMNAPGKASGSANVPAKFAVAGFCTPESTAGCSALLSSQFFIGVPISCSPCANVQYSPRLQLPSCQYLQSASFRQVSSAGAVAADSVGSGPVAPGSGPVGTGSGPAGSAPGGGPGSGPAGPVGSGPASGPTPTGSGPPGSGPASGPVASGPASGPGGTPGSGPAVIAPGSKPKGGGGIIAPGGAIIGGCGGTKPMFGRRLPPSSSPCEKVHSAPLVHMPCSQNLQGVFL